MHTICDEPNAFTENAPLLDKGLLQSKRLETRCGTLFLNLQVNLLGFLRNYRQAEVSSR